MEKIKTQNTLTIHKHFLQLCLVTLILLISVFFYNFVQTFFGTETRNFTKNMSAKQIALQLNIPTNHLMRELNLPLHVRKRMPLYSFNISQKQLKAAVTRTVFKTKNVSFKLYFYVLFSLCGIAFLNFFSNKKDSKFYEKYFIASRISILFLSVLICGFLLGKTFNPMDTFIKTIKSLVFASFTIYVSIFLLFTVISILGNKLICGWACPLGALQELLFYFSEWLGVKKISFSYKITNSIRMSLFFVFLYFILFSQLQFSIYHYFNPFNIFDLYFKPITVSISIWTIILLSFFFYRPFCRLFCPFGLFSWFLEKISFFKIRINSNLCKQCKSCFKVCPTEALQSKVMKHDSIPDCFSCGRCLNVCPFTSISYKKRKLNILKKCLDHENADG